MNVNIQQFNAHFPVTFRPLLFHSDILYKDNLNLINTISVMRRNVLDRQN